MFLTCSHGMSIIPNCGKKGCEVIDMTISKNSVFMADNKTISGSACMARVKRGLLTVVEKRPVEVALPDGRVIVREANVYKALEDVTF